MSGWRGSVVSLVDARETIYQRFVTQWGATSAYTFDNENYDPPVATPWVRLAVRHRDSILEAIGGTGTGGMNRYQRSGVCQIQVFTPVNQGTRQSDTLVQAARAIFEGITLASNAIRFNNVDITEIGPDGSWYLVNVDAAFQYDERK
jgi:hypothetical protein